MCTLVPPQPSEKLISSLQDNQTSRDFQRYLPKIVITLYTCLNSKKKIITYFCNQFCRMSQPLLIGGLLKYFDPVASKRSDLRHACICASGLVFSMLISIVLTRSTYNEILLSGMKVRVACSSILYKKVCMYLHDIIACFRILSTLDRRCQLNNLFEHQKIN